MAKAPAFQFYYDRFNSSTSLWDDAQVGKYVRLMICQANKGFVTDRELAKVASCDEDVLSKFVKISDGKFANEVLSEILAARDKYSENRANNRKTGHYKKKEESYENHMKIIDSSQKNHMVVVDVVVGKEKKESTTVKENSTKAQFNPLDYIPDHWNGDLFLVEWDDFMSSRKKKKWSCTEKVLKERLIQLRKVSGDDWGVAMPIMQKSSERGYAEFFAIDSKQSQNQPIKNERREPVRDKA